MRALVLSILMGSSLPPVETFDKSWNVGPAGNTRNVSRFIDVELGAVCYVMANAISCVRYR
jgi:hypothetical protein